MLSGYIIEKYNTMTGAYTCNRLVEEGIKADIDLEILGLCDTIIAENSVFNKGRCLEQRDVVINRYKWGKVKDEINQLGKTSYNDLHLFQQYINKYEQIKHLRSDEFSVPKTLLGTAGNRYEDIKELVGVPFVAKGLEQSMGNEIILIESIGDFQALQENFGEEKEWLFQEFITTSIGRDMRLFCLKGQVIAGMIRQSQGDFRANVALGATVEPCEITPQLSQIGEDIYKQTGIAFMGIDLMFGEEKPVFCEINVMPGIEGIESISEVNVAKAIIDCIVEELTDKEVTNG